MFSERQLASTDWEMVIVARKLALMSVFFLNTFEFAWLFGSAVLILAVVIQAAAKPYEDKFTDWAEFLTLVAVTTKKPQPQPD